MKNHTLTQGVSVKKIESPANERPGFAIPSHPHARSHTEGGGDGGKYRDDDVQNFAP